MEHNSWWFICKNRVQHTSINRVLMLPILIFMDDKDVRWWKFVLEMTYIYIKADLGLEAI